VGFFYGNLILNLWKTY